MKLRYGAWAGVVAISLLLLFLLPLAPSVRGDAARQAGVLTYPAARAADIVEDYHGTRVADPYRWLEEPDSAETLAFVEAQNRLARAFVDGPVKEQAKARLTAIWNHPRYTNVTRRGKYYTFSKNDGLQPQSVLYVQESLKGEPRVLLDPNKMSDDGTVAVSGAEYTHDGSMLAYGVSVAGSVHKDAHVKLVADGKELPDTLKYMKFAGTAWTHDNGGFFYNRFPQPGSVPASEEAYNNKLYYHKLGTPQEQDALVYEEPTDKELSFGPDVTEDGKYLVLSVSRGSASKNGIMVREVASSEPFVKLIDPDTARFRTVGNDGTTFYFQTDLDAPRGRLIAIDLKNPDFKNAKTLIAQTDEPMNWVRMVNDQFVVSYRKDAYHTLKLFKRDGTFEKDVQLPTVGTINVTGRRDQDEMFVAFESMTHPEAVYRYDFKTGALELFRKNALRFDPEKYETKQLFARSKDGTKVPVFVAHKKGLKLDGTNPAILGAYGGFNVGLGPSFNLARVAWMEQGGVVALAILRGGSEYGEEWHKAGMLGNKQNVFDDFVAAAEHLCKERYTSPKRLAIQGGSNGGLLVAACVLQRPDAFGAVISNVPVTDMLRFHRFTVGRFWVHEYGNAEKDAAAFAFLYKYSPLHNVKAGAKYPPILVTTAEGDDRVVPAHARKLVATLQAKADPSNVVLLLTQTRAGHGAGKPTSKVIDEASDAYAFLARVFGMEWKQVDDGTARAN